MTSSVPGWGFSSVVQRSQGRRSIMASHHSAVTSSSSGNFAIRAFIASAYAVSSFF